MEYNILGKKAANMCFKEIYTPGTRANYYSNPDQMYPPTGTPLGVKGVSNNARLLMENRRAFSKIGTETGKCGSNDKCSHEFLPFCIIEKLVQLKKKLIGLLKPCF